MLISTTKKSRESKYIQLNIDAFPDKKKTLMLSLISSKITSYNVIAENQLNLFIMMIIEF